MNKQELFDTVVNHLRKQGKRSYNNNMQMCMYRGSDGTKCAAGVLIADDEYHPDLEGKTIRALLDTRDSPNTFARKYYLPKLAALVGDGADLLLSLQSVHDQTLVQDWEGNFQSVAHRYGLIYTPPTIYPGTDPIL